MNHSNEVKYNLNETMKKAQSKSEILTEERNYKPENEHCRDNCQEEDVTDGSQEEDGTDDSQEKDGTDGGQEEYGTDDRCIETDEAGLFYGTHETQEVSEGGEADLQTCYSNCTKKQGHSKFVPVNDFNINHLPKDYHDNDLVELIKATADLSVRVAVKMTSTERPEFWSNTNQPYPFYDKRGIDVTKLGTGMVTYSNKWTEKDINKYKLGTCPCQKCQQSDIPSKVWGWVRMQTATHVVFDDLEARHTTCRLFYDGQDSQLVTLDDWTMREAYIESDMCELECVTCDLDLLDKLYKMWRQCKARWWKVYSRYWSSGDEVKLTFIVSHPHGCPKQISVGQWITRYTVSDDRTKCTYTTCTCPGSSGAHVHSLGYDSWSCFANHVHSGVNSEGNNFSGAGRDWS